MNEYLYTTLELAYIINSYNIDIENCIDLLQNIYLYDNPFIQLEYRHDQKKFILAVMDKLNYISDPEKYKIEQKEIKKDMDDFGIKSKLVTDEIEHSFSHFVFKELRIRIQYLNKGGLSKMKLSTLLSKFNAKRRSQLLVSEINNCFLFYHICPTLKDNKPCDISKVKHNDIIYLRAI
ncbi:hypothetical protein [uncultured Ruminococcus sp.]|uniref:hypothetical protein n=1 Tax=uncultured Ruminococcus sp. TaxID=165186 RepID=UPI0025DA4695|nr:hypothetical protein [uncultured Ruminococcus sp.]